MKYKVFFDEEYRNSLLDMLPLKSWPRLIYHKLNSSELALQKSATFWAIKLSNFDFSVHKNAFTDLYKVINITKLRNFQFRLLHNKIFCNNILFYWKVVESQNCEWCPSIQDVCHLLFECDKISELWARLNVMFKRIALEAEVSLHNIIYNLVHPKSAHTINFLCLITKFVIFHNKCNSTLPSYIEITNEFTLLHDIEHFIADKKHKLNRHLAKWGPAAHDITYV